MRALLKAQTIDAMFCVFSVPMRRSPSSARATKSRGAGNLIVANAHAMFEMAWALSSPARFALSSASAPKSWGAWTPARAKA